MISCVGVVVPAVNEEATIEACLLSLSVARDRLIAVASRQVDVRIVVVLDGCVDETAAIVRQHEGVDAITCPPSGVGAARSLGVQRLLASVEVPLRRLWLANTDADSVVPSEWLAAQVDAADHGAHLVLGTVLPEPGLALETERAWFAQHRLGEGHSNVHGANLGIRADVYTALGGWSARRTGEDVELAARASANAQLEIVRTARIPVSTSVRLHGRAPDGFADYLRGLTAGTDVAV